MGFGAKICNRHQQMNNFEPVTTWSIHKSASAYHGYIVDLQQTTAVQFMYKLRICQLAGPTSCACSVSKARGSWTLF